MYVKGSDFMNYFRVGKILTTHGLKGDVKVQNFSDFDRFYKGAKLFIKHKNEYIPVTVNNSSDYGKGLLVSFVGLLDINLVEKYHSDELFISEDDRVNELELDEYYHTDLIGKEVFNQHGKARGIVKEVKELPQCDYLFVNYNGKNYYIPFMKKFIISVSDKIVINELEGLFNED
jgi:16S rRNA processing protein RimM